MSELAAHYNNNQNTNNTGLIILTPHNLFIA